jgi:hypothetical protein
VSGPAAQKRGAGELRSPYPTQHSPGNGVVSEDSAVDSAGTNNEFYECLARSRECFACTGVGNRRTTFCTKVDNPTWSPRLTSYAGLAGDVASLPSALVSEG